MNLPTALLLTIAVLVFIDAIITYVTYKKTEEELDMIRSKFNMLNTRFDVTLLSSSRLDAELENQARTILALQEKVFHMCKRPRKEKRVDKKNESKA